MIGLLSEALMALCAVHDSIAVYAQRLGLEAFHKIITVA